MTEIARRERSNLYNDVISLIANHERFCLDNILEYSPSKRLAERNPVSRVEILTHKDKKHQQHEGLSASS